MANNKGRISIIAAILWSLIVISLALWGTIFAELYRNDKMPGSILSVVESVKGFVSFGGSSEDEGNVVEDRGGGGYFDRLFNRDDAESGDDNSGGFFDRLIGRFFKKDDADSENEDSGESG